ncbi:MAG TPA: hypothetical protein VMF59_04210, partial [Bacteroidota bacterium]|nr:hypothetical protein [Bacteroidota bacterium]
MIPLRHICSVRFRRSEEHEGRYLSAGNLPGGEVRVMILFKGSDYPFEKHYRYARHRSPEAPYTFSE